MKLNVQKRIAGNILKCSPKKVRLDSESLSEIKEAITRADLKSLIKSKIITKTPKRGNSRFHAKKRQAQKVKGRQRGQGNRKGKKNTKTPRKRTWINKVRSQRMFINNLKEKKIIDSKINRELYLKIKGGFFRSLRHLKLYIDDNKLAQKVLEKQR